MADRNYIKKGFILVRNLQRARLSRIMDFILLSGLKGSWHFKDGKLNMNSENKINKGRSFKTVQIYKYFYFKIYFTY